MQEKTYGELITQLCKLRDEMKQTGAGREALLDVVSDFAMAAAVADMSDGAATLEQAWKEIRGC